jgi:hypothetical protein
MPMWMMMAMERFMEMITPRRIILKRGWMIRKPGGKLSEAILLIDSDDDGKLNFRSRGLYLRLMVIYFGASRMME